MWPEAQMRTVSPATPRARPASSDQGRGRASATSAIPATQPRGTRNLDRGTGRDLVAEPAIDGLDDVIHGDGGHDPLVDPAAPPMAGRAQGAAADGHVARRPGAVARGIGGPEDPDHR